MPQFGSLRRAKQASEVAEAIIDLSDPTAAGSMPDDQGDAVAAPASADTESPGTESLDAGSLDAGQSDAGQSDAVDPPELATAAQDSETAETPEAGSDTIPQDPSDGIWRIDVEAPAGHYPSPGLSARVDERSAQKAAAVRGDWVVRVTAVLTLSKGLRSRPAGSLSVLAACSWLLAMVLVGCFTVTAAVGLMGGGPIFDPSVFVSAFRIAHLMPVATSEGPVTLVPMVPSLIVVALTVRASSWLWECNRTGQATPVAPTLSFAGAYVVIAALIATSPTANSQDEPMTQGWAALLGVVLVGVGCTWVRKVGRPSHPRLWTLLRAAGTVLIVLMAMSLLVFIGRMLFAWTEFQAMSDALLDSGAQPASRLDAVVLGSIQLAYLPNVLIWVAAYLLGAGFSVGAETIVSPFTVNTGTLPEIPLITLLPASALTMPWLPPLLVALGSLVAGSVIRGAGLAWLMRTRIAVGAAVTLMCASALAVLVAASAGGLGPGRLEYMGPDPRITWVAAVVVFGLGQLTWALFPSLLADVRPYSSHARHWVTSLRPRRPSIGRPRRPRMTRRRSRGRADEGGTSP